MTPMEKIEVHCRYFRDHHDRLAAELQALEDERLALVRRRMSVIRLLIQELAQAESRLSDRIEASADQFERPRTQIFHGIRVGRSKGQAIIEWDSDTQVIALIREHLAAKAAVLITKPDPFPSKQAMKNLTPEQLEKIGVHRVPGKDNTVIKPVDKEIDRMVSALLKALKKDLTDPQPEQEAQAA